MERLSSQRAFLLKQLAGAARSSNREDSFKQYYLTNSTSKKKHYLDIFQQYLLEQGMTSVNLTDSWKAYLISLGYSGNLTDMEYKYFNAND